MIGALLFDDVNIHFLDTYRLKYVFFTKRKVILFLGFPLILGYRKKRRKLKNKLTPSLTEYDQIFSVRK